jgi:predicted nucleic acid-binding protein
MPFVMDASVTVAWAFTDEAHPVAARALDLMLADTAKVPSLWWFEVRNVLIINERRGRMSAAQSASFLKKIKMLSIAVDGQPDETTVLALARKHRLTVYDASYLALAQRDGVALATLDAALARAAKAEGISLLAA